MPNMTTLDQPTRSQPGPLEPDVTPSPCSSYIFPLSRRNTESTTNSAPFSSVPEGFYNLKIHGNCPHCHHRYTAATIKVSSNQNKYTGIRCSRCKANWFGIGSNSTRLSLLSLESEAPQNFKPELDYRSELVKAMRNITHIGGLGLVPETPAVDESPADSVGNARPFTAETIPQIPITPSTNSSPPVQSEHTERPYPLNDLLQQNGSLIKRFRHKLEERFPIVRKMHIRRFNKRTTPRLTAKSNGKQPRVEPTDAPGQPLDDACDLEGNLGVPPLNNARNDPDADEGPSTVDDKKQIGDLSQYIINEEAWHNAVKISRPPATQEERIRRLRKHFTERDLSQRRRGRGSSLAPSHSDTVNSDDDAGVHAFSGVVSPAGPRRNLSLAELRAVGGAFDILPNEYPTSIRSTVFSQASTAINFDSFPAVAPPPLSPRVSFLSGRNVTSQHQRPRSPRPLSLPPPLRVWNTDEQAMSSQNDLSRRGSIETNYSGPENTSVPSLPGMGRGASPSPRPNGMPQSSLRYSLPPPARELAPDVRDFEPGSTFYVNGHRSDSEQDEESSQP